MMEAYSTYIFPYFSLNLLYISKPMLFIGFDRDLNMAGQVMVKDKNRRHVQNLVKFGNRKEE